MSYQPPPSPHYPSHTLYSLLPIPLNLPTQSSPIKTLSPAPAHPPHAELSSVNQKVASLAFQRLICAQLKDVGFDAVQPSSLERLEVEATAFVQRLYERAHECANLANRATPIVKDLLLACEDDKIEHKALYRLSTKSSKRRKRARRANTLVLVPPPPRSPSPDLLPSDDEGAPPYTPPTLRAVPPQFPSLPPKHTYLRTPASPPKRQAIPSLEKKLKTAALVQGSLKNLLLATEENENQEEAELLGHIVNWEATTYPRKRWKI